MVPNNLLFNEWPEVFWLGAPHWRAVGPAHLALFHILEMNGDSYRLSAVKRPSNSPERLYHLLC